MRRAVLAHILLALPTAAIAAASDLVSSADRASRLLETGDHVAAARVIEPWLDDPPDPSAPPERLDAWLRLNECLAEVRSIQGDLPAAEALLRNVLKEREARSQLDPLARSRTRIALGLCMSLRDRDHALEAHGLIAPTLEALRRSPPPDDALWTDALHAMGAVHFQQGDVCAALERLEEAATFARDHLPDRHYSRLTVQTNLAVARGAVGDHAGALELKWETLDAWPELGRHGNHLYLCLRADLAHTLAIVGRTDAARYLAEQVYDEARAAFSDDHPTTQKVLDVFAEVLEHAGDWTTVAWLREQSLASAARTFTVDDPRRLIGQLQLANARLQLGDLKQAVADMDDAVAALEAAPLDRRADRADVRLMLAEALCDLGDLQRSRSLLLRVIESSADAGDLPRVDTARRQLATTLLNLGEFDAAREILLDLLPRSSPARRRSVLHELLWNEILLGRYEDATLHAEALSDALVAWLDEEEPRGSLRDLQSVAATGRLIVEAIASAALHDDTDHERTLLLIERLRRLGSRSAVSARIAARDPVAASELRELRGVLFVAAESIASLARSDADPGARARLMSAIQRRDQVERRIANRLAAAGDPSLLTGDPLAALREFRPAAPGVAYVRYYDIADTGPGEQYFAYIVDGGPVRCLRLGPANAVDAAINEWRRLLSDELSWTSQPERQEARVRDVGAELFRVLLQPVLTATPRATRLRVALDRGLHLLPLDALPLGDGYVGDQRTIELCTALTEPRSTGDRPAIAGGRLLAIGAIDYDPRRPERPAPGVEPILEWDAPRGASADLLRGGAYSFPALPHSGAELDAIRRCFDDRARVTLLSGSAATRGRLLEQAGDATWLHLATHAWFDPAAIPAIGDGELLDPASGQRTFQSLREQMRQAAPMALVGVALAGANQVDGPLGHVSGVLLGEEIATMDLSRCELVVLSSCDGALGEARPVEGIASLQQAFRFAGARSVLASRWKVADRPTRVLMESFYEAMLGDGADKARALWSAKKDLRVARDEHGRRRFDFRDWAGWALYGDARGVGRE